MLTVPVGEYGCEGSGGDLGREHHAQSVRSLFVEVMVVAAKMTEAHRSNHGKTRAQTFVVRNGVAHLIPTGPSRGPW